MAGEPVITGQLFTDTGVSSSDRISSETDVVGTIAVQGTLTSFTASFGDAPAQAAPVELTTLGVVQPGGQYLIDFATLQTIRLFQFGSGVVPDGSYVLRLRATDNVARSGQLLFSFTRDTIAPLVPSFNLTSQFDPNQDGITTFQFVTLAGTTEAGSSVTLDRGNASVTANASGQFQFTNVELFAGVNSLGTVSMDLAGNVSTFSRTITYDPQTTVNQAPSFTKGANLTVSQGAGLQTVNGWATNISPGPPGEAGQQLTFLISVDKTNLFSQQPAISSTGTLTYQPSANQSGTATIQVSLRDNGGTANGGDDTSDPQSFTITIQAPPPPPRTNLSTVGFYNPTASQFFLKNSNSQGLSDTIFSFGAAGAGWRPLVGDWNNDGTDTVGFYVSASSTFFLKNSNSQGVSDLTFNFGASNAGWVPLVGDWNGDGSDTVGFYVPSTSTFFLKNSNGQGLSDLTFNFGPTNSGWIPLAGDWNGDGIDSVGFYAPQTSTFFLKNANSQGVSDLTFAFGAANAGWIPLVGDWNADRTDSVGFYVPGTSTFFLKNANGQGLSDITFSYGSSNSGWTPLVGDWNGPEARLPGDADGDGAVGTADYAVWAAQFGKTGASLSADFNHDGMVGLADYAIWSANFGRTGGSSGAAGPQAPASLVAAVDEVHAAPSSAAVLSASAEPLDALADFIARLRAKRGGRG